MHSLGLFPQASLPKYEFQYYIEIGLDRHLKIWHKMLSSRDFFRSGDFSVLEEDWMNRCRAFGVDSVLGFFLIVAWL